MLLILCSVSARVAVARCFPGAESVWMSLSRSMDFSRIGLRLSRIAKNRSYPRTACFVAISMGLILWHGMRRTAYLVPNALRYRLVADSDAIQVYARESKCQHDRAEHPEDMILLSLTRQWLEDVHLEQASAHRRSTVIQQACGRK